MLGTGFVSFFCIPLGLFWSPLDPKPKSFGAQVIAMKSGSKGKGRGHPKAVAGFRFNLMPSPPPPFLAANLVSDSPLSTVPTCLRMLMGSQGLEGELIAKWEQPGAEGLTVASPAPCLSPPTR